MLKQDTFIKLNRNHTAQVTQLMMLFNFHKNCIYFLVRFGGSFWAEPATENMCSIDSYSFYCVNSSELEWKEMFSRWKSVLRVWLIPMNKLFTVLALQLCICLWAHSSFLQKEWRISFYWKWTTSLNLLFDSNPD